MIIIGVDPHRSVHVASTVDPTTNRRIDTVKAEASLAGYRRLLRWADKLGERRWAIKNARGPGRHLAQWLVTRDEVVDDVPSTATARVRELSRGVRRKNDVIYAAAAASVAALQGDADQVEPEDLTTVLALLDERRTNVIVQRTRLVNQLHALLRDLVPGWGSEEPDCHHRIEAADQRATDWARRDRSQGPGPGLGGGDPGGRSARSSAHGSAICGRVQQGTRLLDVDGVVLSSPRSSWVAATMRPGSPLPPPQRPPVVPRGCRVGWHTRDCR